MVTSSRITPLAPKEDFLRAAEVAHLCAGGETPVLRSHAAAIERFFTLKSEGMAGRETGLMGLLEDCRGKVARLLQVAPADIAFLLSASEGVSQLAAGLDWRPGDNVVVEDIEYPSDIYPWASLADRGVEVRVARQWGGEPTLERLAATMDERTRVLSVSQVSYLTGRRYRLEELAALAARVGALLSVDATHAVGVLPVEAHYADILVSSCYKYLLGVHGAAVFYRNPRRLRDLAPQTIGWHSVAGERTVEAPTDYRLRPDASRFEAGNPPFMALTVLNNALDYLDGIGRIEEHVLALGERLWVGLHERGLALLTPRERERRGPNICFACHAYNDEADIERLLAALDEVLPAR